MYQPVVQIIVKGKFTSLCDIPAGFKTFSKLIGPTLGQTKVERPFFRGAGALVKARIENFVF